MWWPEWRSPGQHEGRVTSYHTCCSAEWCARWKHPVPFSKSRVLSTDSPPEPLSQESCKVVVACDTLRWLPLIHRQGEAVWEVASLFSMKCHWAIATGREALLALALALLLTAESLLAWALHSDEPAGLLYCSRENIHCYSELMHKGQCILSK